MKNCPWFSLRSNSIESRFRSIRGAIFSECCRDFKKNQKQLGIRFAHTFFLASLNLKQLHPVRTHSGCSDSEFLTRKGACNQGRG